MFTKFYRQFITENTHGNVKHKVLAGTNRIVKALAADTKGITNAFISGSSIAESIAFWPEDARPKLPEDETNPITDEMKQ